MCFVIFKIHSRFCIDNRLYGASSVSQSPARRQLSHRGMKWRENMTDESLKQKCRGSFKILSTKGLAVKGKEREDRVEGKKKKEQSCLVLLR